MPTLTALRTTPHFAPLFAYVHVLCWPILWWNLCRFYTWCRRENITDALYTVNRWGLLKVVYLGDKQDPAAYRPLVRTFRPLTDASWGSDLPLFAADLAAFDTLRLAPILPCEAGAFRDQRSHGDRPGKESMTLFANTS